MRFVLGCGGLLALLAFGADAHADPAPTRPATTRGAATTPSTLTRVNAKTEVVYLRLLKAVPADYREMILGSSGANFGYSAPGLDLVISAALRDRVILDFAPDGVRIESFTDDRKADLRAALVAGRPDPTRERVFTKIASDGTGCTFRLATSKLPSPGATQLHIAGALRLTTGLGEKSSEHRGVALRLGSTIEAGGVRLKITGLGANDQRDAGGEGLVVTFTGADRLGAIKTINFFDENEQLVPARPWGVSRSTEASTIQTALDKSLSSATIKVTYYETVEQVEVPLSLDVSLGL